MSFPGPSGFNDPLTGELRIKDWTETNMVQPGTLPAPQKFVIRSIRAALFSRRGELLPVTVRHYRGAVLELRILQKLYFAAPLWKVADPAALFASSGGQWATGFDVAERLEMIRSLRHTFPDDNPPVMIEWQEPFHVDLKVDPTFEWDKLSSPGSLVVVLEGSLGRAVQ